MTLARDDTPSATHVLYCDEAGHTGTNFLDADQPFYVSAGWLIPARACEGLFVCTGPGGIEWKATTAIKSGRGQQHVLGVFNALRAAGALPFFGITEKRYGLAERVHETLLDEVTNQAA